MHHSILTGEKVEAETPDLLLYGIIGKGSFGEVHLACKKKDREVCPSPPVYACKVLPPLPLGRRIRMRPDPMRAMLEKEIGIHRQIDHPNLVRLHGVYRTEEGTYLLLDHCSEGDLKAFLPKFKFSVSNPRRVSGEEPFYLKEAEARFVLQQVVAGLKYLSSKRIMHRDIKLANILVCRVGDGESIENFSFKIGDLGLAKQLKEHQEVTASYAGTPLAMAPEMIKGQKYDTKADIWSLGTLLFQLLTGAFPFAGKSIAQLQRLQEEGQYSIPEDVPLSMHCLDFLNQCLRFKSEQRSDWAALLNHSFLTEEPEKEPLVRQSLIKAILKQKTKQEGSLGLKMNTKDDISINDAFVDFIIDDLVSEADREEAKEPNPQPKIFAPRKKCMKPPLPPAPAATEVPKTKIDNLFGTRANFDRNRITPKFSEDSKGPKRRSLPRYAPQAPSPGLKIPPYRQPSPQTAPRPFFQQDNGARPQRRPSEFKVVQWHGYRQESRPAELTRNLERSRSASRRRSLSNSPMPQISSPSKVLEVRRRLHTHPVAERPPPLSPEQLFGSLAVLLIFVLWLAYSPPKAAAPEEVDAESELF